MKKLLSLILCCVVFLAITGCVSNIENSTNNDIEIEIDSKDDVYNELFGSKDNNPFYNNEKDIREFIIKYNSNSSNKVNKVEWTKNHTIAQIYFEDEICKINDHSEKGHIITCEFNNGKSKVSSYDLILKDMIKTYNSNINDEKINNQLLTAKNNDMSIVNVDDKVTIQYNYLEEPMSIRAGDSYIIELILGK